MGQVIIFPQTVKNPITLIGHRASFCTGVDCSDPKANYSRGIECIKSNHGRTFEFVDIHMGFIGYSAKVIREWYTHIGGAPARLQESTGYKNYNNFEYIIPKTIKDNPDALQIYIQTMDVINRNVELLKTTYHVPKEDASMLYPLGMTTIMVDHRNARNLIDMSRNRECSRAFWEYRELFNDVKNELANYGPEWRTFIDLTFYPKCVELRYCPEAKSCGRYLKKDDIHMLGLDLASDTV